jgi:CheY-like chemotaxis protein
MWNHQYNRDTLHPARTILIVEDDAVLVKLLLEALQDETPYQVFLATSAEMAIGMLQTITPELFLLDYHLPEMNGLELADHLQSQAGKEHTPIILMSAAFPQYMGSRKQIRCLQKPFDLETLLQWVAELLITSYP